MIFRKQDRQSVLLDSGLTGSQRAQRTRRNDLILGRPAGGLYSLAINESARSEHHYSAQMPYSARNGEKPDFRESEEDSYSSDESYSRDPTALLRASIALVDQRLAGVQHDDASPQVPQQRFVQL